MITTNYIKKIIIKNRKIEFVLIMYLVNHLNIDEWLLQIVFLQHVHFSIKVRLSIRDRRHATTRQKL